MTIFEFIGQALVGWMIADALGGVVHWWLDRVGSPTMPLIGKQVAANHLHHDQPLAFAKRSLWVRNGSLWALVAVLALLWLVTLGPSVVLLFAALGASLTNEVHLQAHRPLKANRAIRLLQDIGIIQSPKHHAGHHKKPHDRNYCPLTDWLNPVVYLIRKT